MSWKMHQSHAAAPDGLSCIRCGIVSREFASTTPCPYQSPSAPAAALVERAKPEQSIFEKSPSWWESVAVEVDRLRAAGLIANLIPVENVRSANGVVHVVDGDWIDPTPQQNHTLICCDCGLVHSMDFRIEDGRVNFRAFRDELQSQAWREANPELPMQPSSPAPAVAVRAQAQEPLEQIIAETIARIAHFGQTTKSEGEDFINHPFNVAMSVAEEYRAAAWLHDVLEDCPWLTREHLYAAGIERGTIEAVVLVSRDTGETYDEFIHRIAASGNVAAITVKLADLRHNLRPSCPPDLKRRYLKAVPILKAALRSLRSDREREAETP